MSGTRRVLATWFRSGDLLDRTFAVGVIAKGLNDVLELAGGLLLLLVTPATINRVVAAVTQGELSEDPRDVIATLLLRAAHSLTGSAVLFGAIYLLAHGLVKILLRRHAACSTHNMTTSWRCTRPRPRKRSRSSVWSI